MIGTWRWTRRRQHEPVWFCSSQAVRTATHRVAEWGPDGWMRSCGGWAILQPVNNIRENSKMLFNSVISRQKKPLQSFVAKLVILALNQKRETFGLRIVFAYSLSVFTTYYTVLFCRLLFVMSAHKMYNRYCAATSRAYTCVYTLLLSGAYRPYNNLSSVRAMQYEQLSTDSPELKMKIN